MKNIIANYLTELQNTLRNLDQSEILEVAEILKNARDTGKQIFIFGNGGSGSTATHFACDINKGVSYNRDKRFKVICLNDNIPTMLAYSNDVGYDVVFSEQLKNFIEEGDVVIGISGSGNSKNIIKAMETAKESKAITIGITGFSGGKLKEMADYSLNAGVNDMQLSEDVHMIWVHIMMKCFEYAS
ncbi:SIS domain-containing protein [Chitinophaga sp. sic0106]|uniref:D-sedoheptulose-7-phosphate isomerase n=1 Tax=Chitinophaga sp. sic0106 TaxID=2854785 RepID=UPI001C448B69|nr:SIS domain-containing protein [Chitinophaga sp. sic0106]MBV7529005.1 SIS domain-containing protein [Chitinophaga sp. sic0106]